MTTHVDFWVSQAQKPNGPTGPNAPMGLNLNELFENVDLATSDVEDYIENHDVMRFTIDLMWILYGCHLILYGLQDYYYYHYSFHYYHNYFGGGPIFFKGPVLFRCHDVL